MQYIHNNPVVYTPSSVYGENAEPKLRALLGMTNMTVIDFRPPKNGDQYIDMAITGVMRAIGGPWGHSAARLIVTTKPPETWWE